MVEREQRKHPRQEFKELPWVFTVQLKKPVNADRSLRFEAKNISLGGLKFISNQRIPLFDEVSFLFFDKESGKELIKLAAKVVRLEEVDTGTGEKIYGIAVAFQAHDIDNFSQLLPTKKS